MKLQSKNSSIEINILRRSLPESNDFEDGNWLEAEIKINVSGFQALYGTNLRSIDFEQFYLELEKLKNNKTKKIEFTTLEEGLYLKGNLDITGNINWEGVAESEYNILKFILETDNASIEKLANQVKKILLDYPVVGYSYQ